jgi:hypothetical protein
MNSAGGDPTLRVFSIGGGKIRVRVMGAHLAEFGGLRRGGGGDGDGGDGGGLLDCLNKNRGTGR